MSPESADDLLFVEAIEIARNARASDVHFVVGRPPALRVHGKLAYSSAAAVERDELLRTIRRILPDSAWSMYERHGDVGAANHGDLGPLRLHAYSTLAGPALAVRLLPRDVPTLELLGLPSVVCEFADAASGLIVFSGPTGSGKTSSLAAIIDRINKTSARIVVTIEDPVEYVHRPRLSIVHQREIGKDAETFEAGLLVALRSDPDVIVLGEIRSAQAIRVALRAAETGHLVLTTLHASDTTRAVSRLVDAFPAERQSEVRSKLADVFVGIIAQRLIPTLDGGRCCAAEVLTSADSTRSLIRDGKFHQLRNAIEMGKIAGMRTLEADLQRLVCEGVIREDEARRYACRPVDIAALAGAMS